LPESGRGPAPPPLDHAANLLGALAFAVTDRTVDAVAETGESGTAAVALSALYQFLDRPTVDLLRRVLGLTSSGAVRLVDRLESAGWVQRVSAPDGRATAVVLTSAGRRIAKRVSAARINLLKQMLSTLPSAKLSELDDILSLLLVGFMRGPGAVRWMCRFCDMHACGWEAGHCPVRNAARERFGAPKRDVAEQ
jgi:DNA-binding MarR family transcriptional regulator